MGYPDGEVDRVPSDELVEAVWAVLEPEQPTVVWTSGPDGIFGDPDHIAIGAATDAAFGAVPATTGRRSVGCCTARCPSRCSERWNANRAELGLWVWDPTQTYHMRGVPDEEIGMVVDCRGVSRRIIAGLREHRSQHHVMSDDPTTSRPGRSPCVARAMWSHGRRGRRACACSATCSRASTPDSLRGRTSRRKAFSARQVEPHEVRRVRVHVDHLGGATEAATGVEPLALSKALERHGPRAAGLEVRDRRVDEELAEASAVSCGSTATREIHA